MTAFLSDRQHVCVPTVQYLELDRMQRRGGVRVSKPFERVAYGARCGKTYQVMTLSAMGEADTPAGGSVCMRCSSFVSMQPVLSSCPLLQAGCTWRWRTLKSRIKRRRAAVDMMNRLDCYRTAKVREQMNRYTQVRQVVEVGVAVHV